MNARYTLGGRVFIPVTHSTVEHDLHYLKLRTKAGFDHMEKLPEESWEDWARRLLDRVIATGQILPLLGCLLIPEGTDPEKWTPELAEETARHLGKINRPDEKSVVQDLAASILRNFFESGPTLSLSLKTFFSEGGGRPGHRNGTPAGGANGPIWFRSSAGVISTGLRRFFAGLSGRPSSSTGNG